MFPRQSVGVLVGVWLVALCVRAGAVQQPATPPVPGAPPAASGGTTTLSGVYTEKQAEAGGDLFGNICSGCHKTNEHSGLSFKLRWSGAPLFDLYDTIGSTMPKDDPESLSQTETAQVVAYLLKLNGMPAGKTDLPTDADALKKIKIELPKDKAPS